MRKKPSYNDFKLNVRELHSKHKHYTVWNMQLRVIILKSLKCFAVNPK